MSVFNPTLTVVESAKQMLGHLSESVGNFELVIEQKSTLLSAYLEAKAAYDEAEAEFLFDLSFNDENYAKAKNAEAREIVKDYALVQARQSGKLRQAWKILCDAQNSKDATQMTFEQCDARFKATRIACELQAAMLWAIAKG